MKSHSKYMYVKTTAVTTSLARRKFMKQFSLFMLAAGVMLISYVSVPLAQWQLFYAPTLSSGTVLSPIPKAIMLNSQAIGTVLGATKQDRAFDSNYASSWFPLGNPNQGEQKEYSFSIEKLGIRDAKVIVGSDDLSKSLVHYGGSSLPGEYGNAVIFGHSVLPQFFNAANYKTIFSTLHTLKKGDKITIARDGVTYVYTIFDFKVVDPDEISVLEQTYDAMYLTVITCTPPGTYWKRLVVKAKIDKI